MTLNSMAPLEPVIGVIGTGYLGTTHAACMAELGFDVVAQDQSRERVARLAAGELPFYEPALAELVRRHTSSGRLRFTATSPTSRRSPTCTSSASAPRRPARGWRPTPARSSPRPGPWRRAWSATR